MRYAVSVSFHLPHTQQDIHSFLFVSNAKHSQAAIAECKHKAMRDWPSATDIVVKCAFIKDEGD